MCEKSLGVLTDTGGDALLICFWKCYNKRHQNIIEVDWYNASVLHKINTKKI